MIQEIQPGLHGKMVHGKQLTWAFWEVEQGAGVPEHHHPHEQIMHVVEGEFEFTLNGENESIYKWRCCGHSFQRAACGNSTHPVN